MRDCVCVVCWCVWECVEVCEEVWGCVKSFKSLTVGKEEGR